VLPDGVGSASGNHTCWVDTKTLHFVQISFYTAKNIPLIDKKNFTKRERKVKEKLHINEEVQETK
jgi:hypothetical protein